MNHKPEIASCEPMAKKQSMKKFYLFLLFSLLPWKVFASDDAIQGILRQLIEEDAAEISLQESSTFKPEFKNRAVFDVNFNDEYQSTDRKDEYLDSFARGRLNSSFKFTKHFSINGFFSLSPTNKASETSRREASPSGGGDRSFEYEGLSVGELNLTYSRKKYTFLLGKFGLNFCSSCVWNRGLWTYSIAGNYGQGEKLGISGIYRLGDSEKTGRYQFGYAIFTNDRKNLDNSTITSRDSDKKSDAVPGDTRFPASYLASLDINFDFSKREKLSYHFAYEDLAVNKQASSIVASKIASQQGFVAGMNYKYPLGKNLGKNFGGENFDLDALLEYASIKNYKGNADISENYFTGNLIGRLYQNWNITLGYAERQNSQVNATGFDQNLSEISFGYEFQKNSFFDKLLFQVGYKNQRDDYKTSLETRNVLGALIRYQKDF